MQNAPNWSCKPISGLFESGRFTQVIIIIIIGHNILALVGCVCVEGGGGMEYINMYLCTLTIIIKDITQWLWLGVGGGGGGRGHTCD